METGQQKKVCPRGDLPRLQTCNPDFPFETGSRPRQDTTRGFRSNFVSFRLVPGLPSQGAVARTTRAPEAHSNDLAATDVGASVTFESDDRAAVRGPGLVTSRRTRPVPAAPRQGRTAAMASVAAPRPGRWCGDTTRPVGRVRFARSANLHARSSHPGLLTRAPALEMPGPGKAYRSGPASGRAVLPDRREYGLKPHVSVRAQKLLPSTRTPVHRVEPGPDRIRVCRASVLARCTCGWKIA